MATYYTDSNDGVDGAGRNGSVGQEWATLAYACTRVATLGDIIHVNSGTYNEYQKITPAPNVSIEGLGYNAHIISEYAGSSSDALIECAGGSNSAQHISGIRLQGNVSTTNCGISIINRSNVTISNCLVDDFRCIGIYMDTGTDNLITGCAITNSGGAIGLNHYPNIRFTAQTSSDIVNCVITQTARGIGYDGEGINGYEKNLGGSIHGCTIITQTPDDSVWTFGVELWDLENFDFYQNTVNYGFAPGGHTGTINVNVYENLFGPETLPSVNNVSYGLQFENYQVSGITVQNNTFRNLQRSILFCHYNANGMYVEDIYIYSNKFYGCGVSGIHDGAGIYFQTGDNSDQHSEVADYYDNINIINNTIVADATWPALYGILLPAQANTSITNFTVKNNAIIGFYSYPVYAYRQDTKYTLTGITNLNITYNDFYNNGTNAAYFNGFTPGGTVDVITGNITTDPNFTSDYHLQSGSGNIGAGTVIGSPVLYDFAGDTWDSPPSIGCFKYGTSSIYSVPNTNTFSLQDVCNVVLPSVDTLVTCFDEAVSAYFDAAYEGDHDRLSNFRNYGSANSIRTAVFGLYTGGGNGEIYSDTTLGWANCRNAVNGILDDVNDPYRVGVYYDYDNTIWSIRRLFMCFDLSGLEGKTCVSATLRVGLRSHVGSDAVIYGMVGTQSIPLVYGNFSSFSWSTYIMSGDQGIINQPACGTGDLNYIYLSATSAECDVITSTYFTGLFKLVIVHDYDFHNQEPDPDEEQSLNLWQVGECLTNCVCAPVLTITYLD
jgi:hypothetical protein